MAFASPPYWPAAAEAVDLMSETVNFLPQTFVEHPVHQGADLP
jgi:hypothetical protein